MDPIELMEYQNNQNIFAKEKVKQIADRCENAFKEKGKKTDCEKIEIREKNLVSKSNKIEDYLGRR